MKGRCIEIGVQQGVDRNLPLLICPKEPGSPLSEALPELVALVDEQLPVVGAFLLRGFAVGGDVGFRQFAERCGDPLLSYEFGSTPRSAVAEGVYTATEYPRHLRIPLHNEQSYTREWGMRIWFYCLRPATTGGETPIADSRRIYQKIDPRIRQQFEQKGVLYVRNYGNGLDVPWQKVFNTSARAEVESYCRDRGISWRWKPDNELRTWQRCSAVERHPVTGEWVWFNQAHLFHISTLSDDVREALLESVDSEDLPRNAYFGDGSSIPEEALSHIRQIIDAETVSFGWQGDDVMLLDNMLCAHGRATFSGDRVVHVAMARRHSSSWT